MEVENWPSADGGLGGTRWVPGWKESAVTGTGGPVGQFGFGRMEETGGCQDGVVRIEVDPREQGWCCSFLDCGN